MDIQEARRSVGRLNRSGVQDGDYFPLAGGLNIVDTPLQIAPGELIDGLNYEPRTLGGYQRLQGYERFDGQTPPSQESTVAAREAQRALIQAVPGSGPVRGVFILNGLTYAFRDNIGGTAEVMYVQSISGWQAITLNTILKFTAGSHINLFDRILGQTTGAGAQVLRIVLQSGSWSSGTAQGYLVLGPVTSGPFSPTEILNNFTQLLGVVAQVAGAQYTPVLLPRGSFDFVIQNFYGSSGTVKVYGCDGVNNAFEFIAGPGFVSCYCPIYSGMAVDAPIYLEAHRGRLWLAFRSGSLQPSGINDPVVFSALQGAAELGIGYEITGLLGEMSPSQSAFYSTATLFVFTREEIFTITGDGPNWILGPFAVESGAAPFSVQRMGQGILLNARGFSTLQSIQQLGNFALSTFSQKIQSLIQQILANAVCSCVSKNRSLYRLFMNDGRFISIGFKDLKITGITICDLTQPMSCAWSGRDINGNEQIMLGGANGMVYRMDSGIQIDGASLNAFLHTAFHFSKSPSRQKRYRRAQLDLLASGTCTLAFAPDYSYGSANIGSDASRTLASVGVAQNPGIWANFSWSNATIAKPTFKLEGSGSNAGFVIQHQSTNENPHTIQGLTLHESLRRLDRGSNS